jgi:hypothetical protein
VFTAVGVVMLIVDRDERLTGALVILVFGSCLLVFVAPVFERSEQRTRRAVITHRSERSEALVFPVSRPQFRIFGIAAGLWAIAGVLMVVFPQGLADPGESTEFVRGLGLVMVALFGGVAVLAVIQEVRGGFVALLPHGIFARVGIAETYVPWDAIESVGFGSQMVALRANDPSAVEVSWWLRIFSRSNRAFMDADVVYGPLAVPGEEVAEAISERLGQARRRTGP